MPLKPLASAPFRTESDISVTAAKSTLDPAVCNCKGTVTVGECHGNHTPSLNILLTDFPRSPKQRFVPLNPLPPIHLLMNLKVPNQQEEKELQLQRHKENDKFAHVVIMIVSF